MQRFFLLMICLLPLLGIHAQDFTVTGKVVDNTGLEVIGANISIKGSAGVGTITNIDGQYTLKVSNPAKDVLIISYIGMKTQEIAVKGQKQINVTLQEDSKVLDEVVVIGYGTAKRGDLTGSVVSVKNEDLMQTPYRLRPKNRKTAAYRWATGISKRIFPPMESPRSKYGIRAKATMQA